MTSWPYSVPCLCFAQWISSIPMVLNAISSLNIPSQVTVPDLRRFHMLFNILFSQSFRSEHTLITA